MNAQEQWKEIYLIFSDETQPDDSIREEMRAIRREAALERKLAAAEREIDRLRRENRLLSATAELFSFALPPIGKK